jgi:hypothetical protein
MSLSRRTLVAGLLASVCGAGLASAAPMPVPAIPGAGDDTLVEQVRRHRRRRHRRRRHRHRSRRSRERWRRPTMNDGWF